MKNTLNLLKQVYAKKLKNTAPELDKPIPSEAPMPGEMGPAPANRHNRYEKLMKILRKGAK
jgi:hypothetical protein